MAALAEYADQCYLDRLVSLVSDSAPPEESPSSVRERCRELVRRARCCGFSTEFEVATYVACGFVEGMDFDQRDDRRYRSVLESAGLSARSKAEMLAFVLDNAAEEDADED
jgi:hypothetical protein